MYFCEKERTTASRRTSRTRSWPCRSCGPRPTSSRRRARRRRPWCSRRSSRRGPRGACCCEFKDRSFLFLYFVRLRVQLAEPFRRCGHPFITQVLVRALPVDDLLQPIPRPSEVLRQAKIALEERFAEITRGDVRTEVRRLGASSGLDSRCLMASPCMQYAFCAVQRFHRDAFFRETARKTS